MHDQPRDQCMINLVINTTKINTAKRAGRVLRQRVTGDPCHLEGWRGLPGGGDN